MAFDRREYKGAAVDTSLDGSINSSVTTIVIDDATGWPDGSTGPFAISIDREGTEEKVLCISRTGTTLTVRTTPSTGRGYDDTAAVAHDSGVSVEHVLTKTDLDEANQHYSGSEADPHSTKLLNNARHDLTARHLVGTSIQTGTPSAITGAAASAGVSTSAPRLDHHHTITVPACRLTRSSAQSIPDNTITAITWNAETYDTNSMHTGGSSQLVFPTGGIYIITANVQWASNATGFRRLRLVKNGVDVLAFDSRSAVSGGNTEQNLSTTASFAANDYIELAVVQTSGGALDVNFANYYTPILAATYQRLEP
jgi:hypothetical protein